MTQKLRIKWTEKLVKVSDLKPFERNPRSITSEQFNKLKKAIEETGYHSRIKATRDLKIVGGHQRQKALQELGIHEIEVLMPDRDLTEDEFRRILIQDNVAFGSFDFDILSADFEMRELIDWGMPPNMLDCFKEEKPEDASEQLEGLKFQVIVECNDEMHQVKILENLQNQGFKCKALIV